MSEDCHRKADTIEIGIGPDKKLRREAENGVRQFNTTLAMIREALSAGPRSFRLRQSMILKLHKEALRGIHELSGTYRRSLSSIDDSHRLPPKHTSISGHMDDMCEYVNANWYKSGVHLAAYVLCSLHWIHPFVDGNGRTARAVTYLVLSVRLNFILPGAPTIPDLIAVDKGPYYRALEEADRHWLHGQQDISAMEQILSDLLKQQLSSATQQAYRSL